MCQGWNQSARRWFKKTSLNLSPFVEQWSGQKSGGDSAVSSEFVIAGMIFHPSRVKSQLLHKDIKQSFVELTLLISRMTPSMGKRGEEPG
jgi:hypothetical protein